MTRWIGISLGDVTGIGPEVTLKTLATLPAEEDTRFLLIGDAGHIHTLNKRLGLDIPLKPFSSKEAEGHFFITDPQTEPLPAQMEPGSPLAARAAVDWLREGAQRCLSGELGAMVTAPVNKHSI